MDVQLLLVFPAKTAGSKRALLAVVGAKLTLLKALHGYCPSWVCRQLLLRGSRCCEQTMPRVASTDTTAAPSLRAAPLRRNKPDSTSGGPLCFQQGCMHAARGMSICRWRALEALFAAFSGPGRGCACRPLPEKKEREALPGCLSPLARLRAPASHSPPGAHSTCACESSQPRPIRPHHLPPSAQPGPPGLRGRAGSEKQPSWGSNGPPYPGVVQLPGACGIAVLGSLGQHFICIPPPAPSSCLAMVQIR